MSISNKEVIGRISGLSRDDEHKLYLSEIIKMERPKFKSNNLILAPVGSGKTTLIEDIMLKSGIGKALMLVSNTTLKDSLCPADLVLREEMSNGMYTTKRREVFSIDELKIHLMTYSEFGNRIYENNDFLNDIEQIHCDEIHSLPGYQMYNNDVALAHAIKYLFNKQEDKQIFYFTATNEYLLNMEKRRPGTLKCITTFDYTSHKDIKRYMALSEHKINHVEQIRPFLKDRIKSFNYYKYKGLAFSRTISGQEKIERIVVEEGFRPLILWSVNNERIMSGEQLRAREELINTGHIPDPYNFLIINSAMQEGWNLKDNKVKLAIINTINETEHTQALGRVRHDIDLLIYRTSERDIGGAIRHVPQHYLNKELTPEMKKDLCKDLNLINSNGITYKWSSIKKLLMQIKYEIIDSQITLDGKRVRVSKIIPPIKPAKPIIKDKM